MTRIQSVLLALATIGITSTASATPIDEIANTYGLAADTADARIAPDGRHVALECSPQGKPAICIFPLDSEERPKLFQLSDGQELSGFFWASDDHMVALVRFFDRLDTASGLRDFRIDRAISHSLETGRSTMLMSQFKNFISTTDIKAICDQKPDKVFMEMTLYTGESDRRSMDRLSGSRGSTLTTVLYEVDLDNGKADVEKRSSDSTWTYIMDGECKPTMRVNWNPESRDFSIQEIRGRKDLFSTKAAQNEIPMGFVALLDNGSKALMRVDDGQRFGLHTIDLSTSSIEPWTIGGQAVGNPSIIRDRFRNTVVGIGYTNDMYETEFSDPELARIKAELDTVFPGDMVYLTGWTRDRNLFTVGVESAGRPAQFYLFDAKELALSPLGEESPLLRDKPTGSVTAISYTARDGMELEGYLTLPPGKTRANGPFPTILLPHGGPEARDTAHYDWWAQAYAAAGYAVFQPNFRGSAGYGAAYRNAGYGQFGDKMVTDVLDGYTHLVFAGIAKPGGTCTIGGSYGGYSALMSALHDSDTVKCVVSVNGVTDVFDLMGQYDNGSSIYNYWTRYVGATTFSDGAAISRITPNERTGEFTAPVLLIHGKEDTSVPFRQAEAFRRAWGNRPGLTFIALEGQDHFLQSTEARTRVLRESLQFLNTHFPAN